MQNNNEHLGFIFPNYIDENCYNYIKINNYNNLNILITNNNNYFCRYNDVGGEETVFITGDSHALCAFEGLAREYGSRSINTLMIARPGDLRPIFGIEDYTRPGAREEWLESTGLIYQLISDDKNIVNVFIITRGPVYISDYYSGKALLTGMVMSKEIFKYSLQTTINFLISKNKKVYIISEVPELEGSYNFYRKRPMIKYPEHRIFMKKIALQRQNEYFNILYSLNNVSIINNINIFCPNNYCMLYSENDIPLYIDNNHLSIEGSYFQADRLATGSLLP
jgi:hypothetical protein